MEVLVELVDEGRLHDLGLLSGSRSANSLFAIGIGIGIGIAGGFLGRIGLAGEVGGCAIRRARGGLHGGRREDGQRASGGRREGH